MKSPDRVRFATIVGFAGETCSEDALQLVQRVERRRPTALERQLHDLIEDLKETTASNATLREEVRQLKQQRADGKLEKVLLFWLLVVVSAVAGVLAAKGWHAPL